MAASIVPIVFSDPVDPTDYLDWQIDFSPRLLAGETIASKSIVLSGPAVSAGLIIASGGNAPALTADGKSIVYWLSVSSGQQANPAFDSDGTDYLLFATITTTNTPPRVFDRTFKFRVKQL